MAIVIPFAQDLDALERNINRWSRFSPFTGPYNVKKHLDCILYFHQDHHTSPLRSRIEALQRKLVKLSFFNSVFVLSADLSGFEDSYPVGPSNMFFQLMLATPIIEDNGYDFVFWMEPDCHPIRPGWLTRLYALAVSSGPYWILGSGRRGVYELEKSLEYAKNHINGNAIYRFVSKDFRSYLEAVQEDFYQDLTRYMRSFDVALHLYRRKLLPKCRQTGLLHRFQYTDVIVNFWRTKVTLQDILTDYPGAYLAHGRNIIIPD